ncbi:MAG: hypothetical protein LBS74_03045 [Oscillospiraceae bacterium]|jgi:hypothetical protein|nr:hypothetical protein [Oscillospiraceae bacterium]
MENNEFVSKILTGLKKIKWWGWVLIAIAFLLLLSQCGKNPDKKSTDLSSSSISSQQQTEKLIYTIKGEELGEYGKKITLNKDSDTPVDKYIYKLPSGSYKVTTAAENIAAFSIVKDELNNNGDEKYPEELNYIGGQYLLTLGTDTLNGKAVKEVVVTINDDESIQIVGTDEFVFEKQ